MRVSFLSLFVLLFLSGCYSQTPKQAVTIIEKSSNLENIDHQRLTKIPAVKKNTPKTSQRSLQKNNNTKRKQVTKKINGKSLNWQIPVHGKINKTFSSQHQGLTFNTSHGQEIRAIRDGKIIYIGDKMKSHGKMIIMRHPFGFYSTYTQTQGLQVALGDQVNKGQVIASTNNQPFYFEMKKFKQTINPLNYLK